MNELTHHANSPNFPKPNSTYSFNSLNALYGDEKIKSIYSRYGISIPLNPAENLKAKDIHKLLVGLNDISFSDLESFLKHIADPPSLTKRESDALATLQALQPNIVTLMRQHRSPSTLPADVFNLLVKTLQHPTPEYPTPNLVELEKITSLPAKYLEHGFWSHKRGRSAEDEERIRLCQTLETLGPNDQKRYCEELSKILVKKHLYYENNETHTLHMGMLVPGLKGKNGKPRWYRIDSIIDSGLAKFAYRLVPATQDYAADMPDIVLYRSSSTLPTATDSFTSYLTDLNIRPPGYLGRNRCVDQEVEWLTTPTASPAGNASARPLLITGHSLGAANSQLALINLQRKNKWPDRPISLELFDSPAIDADDAKKFARWIEKKGLKHQLRFNYHVSHKDIVPFFGAFVRSSYLGNYISSPMVSAQVHLLKLTKQGDKKREVAGLVGPHGRMYYRGENGADYIDDTLSIAAFDESIKWRRRLINMTFKVMMSILAWTILALPGLLKRFLVGRRYHKAHIADLYQKIRHYAHTKPL